MRLDAAGVDPVADATPIDPHRLQAVPPSPFGPRRWVGFPAVLPSLIGREREVGAVHDLLRQSDHHLITLTGPGGIGKTRLAIAAAAETAAGFADGAAFVPLAAVTNPALALPAIAQALDIRETLERPVLAALTDALRERCLLLVLDNFEHVLPAAGELAALLESCPQVTALVTSRAPLRLSIEQRFVTPPLALPDPGAHAGVETLARYEAVALFIARARAVRHDFALDVENVAATVEICRRLDGVPLAIELAAAWVRAVPPTALLPRLEPRLALLYGGAEDQPVRLRTMRDAIAWSYDLLPADEARLLRRLAVFIGGFTLEAAEAVGGFPTSDSVLDLVAALIDKSLVQPVHVDGGEPRYQMLETVREFAREQLAESGESEAIAAAHARSMRDFAERVEPVLLGPEEQFWQARVDAELGNLRAALAWGLEHDVATALRIAAALWVYWSWYQLAEGRRWLTAALDRASGESALIQTRALTVDGALAALEGNLASSFAGSRAAVDLACASGDPVAEALARWIAACAWLYTDRLEEAVPELERALVLFEQATTTTVQVWAAYARSHRAIAAAWLGDQAQGLALYEEALAQSRATGSDGITMTILSDLAGWCIGLGETARARDLLQESLTIAANRRELWVVVAPLFSLALIDAIEGAAATAARRLGASHALVMLASLEVPSHIKERLDRATALASNALGDAAFAAMWEAGRADPAAVIAAAAGQVSAAVGDDAAPYGLTGREREVLRLLTDGQTDKAIAETLFVTRRTASKHVAAILTNLGVDSRTAAVAVALRQGLR